jgi:hypothetical protein
LFDHQVESELEKDLNNAEKSLEQGLGGVGAEVSGLLPAA